MIAMLKRWVARNIIAADPFPSYSYIDWLDGLGRDS